jgi:uncharacterized protein with HEPN domain
MSNSLRDVDYLEHVQDAIEKVVRYTKGKSESDFIGDELIQDGVIRNLEIIGEAVSKQSPELKARHADVPWGDISGMRNRLIHGYITVNLEIVWSTVVKVLPDFQARVADIQRQLSNANR